MVAYRVFDEMPHRWFEEAFGHGDRVAAGRAKAVVQREGENEQWVLGCMWSEGPIETCAHRGSIELGKTIHCYAKECSHPKRAPCHLHRINGARQVGWSGASIFLSLTFMLNLLLILDSSSLLSVSTSMVSEFIVFLSSKFYSERHSWLRTDFAEHRLS